METKDISLGVDNPALMLAKKLKEKNNSLFISRVPKGTRETFIAIADEEFCSDYGMLLKFLVDKMLDTDSNIILNKLAEHEERLSRIEDGGEQPQVTKIKTLGGRTIKKEDKK